MSVKKGGNVLIPCHCTGVLLDLIEWLISHLSKNNITDVPIIIVSPVADAALAHPDIYGEWLNATLVEEREREREREIEREGE